MRNKNEISEIEIRNKISEMKSKVSYTNFKINVIKDCLDDIEIKLADMMKDIEEMLLLKKELKEI